MESKVGGHTTKFDVIKLFARTKPQEYEEDIIIVNSSHICNVCFEHFSTDVDLNEHMKIHAVLKCYNFEESNWQLTESNDLKIQVKEHVSEIPVARQERENSNIKNVSQPMKRPKTKSQSNYKASFGDKKRHTCGICTKYFSTDGNLTRHMKIHSGIKPYKCKDCEREFTQNNDLKRHMKIHTRERIPVCTNF